MSVLGIDFGSRRIGLAISDPEERIAFPAGTLESRGRKADVAAIRDFAEERGVRQVVVGLPLHMDGRAGTGAAAARAFAEALAKELELPVETLDERWTTREAERTLRETGGSGLARRTGVGKRKKRGATDTLAATLLLRTFLERRHPSGGGRS
jgi:putative Holliday junction resolvase